MSSNSIPASSSNQDIVALLQEGTKSIAASEAELSKIKAAQERTQALQQKSSASLEQQQREVEAIQLIQNEDTKRLAVLTEQSDALALDVEDAKETSQRQEAEIQNLTASSSCLPTYCKVAICFRRFRDCALYPCVMLGTGTATAIVSAVVFQSSVAAGLGCLGGAAIGGAGVYTYRRVRGFCSSLCSV